MKLKLQRLAFQICFILFSIILPIAVIGIKFELYTKWKQTHPLIQISMVGIVLIVLGLIAFKKRVSKWVREMEPCLARYILEALSGVWVYALLVVITQSLQNNIDAVAFCASWALGFNLVVLSKDFSLFSTSKN